MTYAALAAHLSLTPAAVRGLLHRARTALQRNVELAEIAVRHHYDALAMHAAALHARTAAWPRGTGWSSVALTAALVVTATPATRPGHGLRDGGPVTPVLTATTITAPIVNPATASPAPRPRSLRSRVPHTSIRIPGGAAVHADPRTYGCVLSINDQSCVVDRPAGPSLPVSPLVRALPG